MTISGVTTSGSTVELTLETAITSVQTIRWPTSIRPRMTTPMLLKTRKEMMWRPYRQQSAIKEKPAKAPANWSTVNDKDWNENVGGGHSERIFATQHRDTSKAISHQWYADDIAVAAQHRATSNLKSTTSALRRFILLPPTPHSLANNASQRRQPSINWTGASSVVARIPALPVTTRMLE